jgi:hypothetical protein
MNQRRGGIDGLGADRNPVWRVAPTPVALDGVAGVHFASSNVWLNQRLGSMDDIRGPQRLRVARVALVLGFDLWAGNLRA